MSPQEMWQTLKEEVEKGASGGFHQGGLSGFNEVGLNNKGGSNNEARSNNEVGPNNEVRSNNEVGPNDEVSFPAFISKIPLYSEQLTQTSQTIDSGDSDDTDSSGPFLFFPVRTSGSQPPNR
jgi:hypothetical protein